MHNLNLSSPYDGHLSSPFKLLHLFIYQPLYMIVLSGLFKTHQLVSVGNNVIQAFVERSLFNLTCLPLQR